MFYFRAMTSFILLFQAGIGHLIYRYLNAESLVNLFKALPQLLDMVNPKNVYCEAKKNIPIFDLYLRYINEIIQQRIGEEMLSDVMILDPLLDLRSFEPPQAELRYIFKRHKEKEQDEDKAGAILNILKADEDIFKLYELLHTSGGWTDICEDSGDQKQVSVKFRFFHQTGDQALEDYNNLYNFGIHQLDIIIHFRCHNLTPPSITSLITSLIKQFTEYFQKCYGRYSSPFLGLKRARKNLLFNPKYLQQVDRKDILFHYYIMFVGEPEIISNDDHDPEEWSSKLSLLCCSSPKPPKEQTQLFSGENEIPFKYNVRNVYQKSLYINLNDPPSLFISPLISIWRENIGGFW